MLWYNPITTVKMLFEKNYLEELLQVWFGGLGYFITEYEKERELYGIAALLSLSEELFPHVLALSAVMKEVIKASREVLEFRKRGGKALEAKLDPAESQAMTGSTEEENDDDNEQVD